MSTIAAVNWNCLVDFQVIFLPLQAHKINKTFKWNHRTQFTKTKSWQTPIKRLSHNTAGPLETSRRNSTLADEIQGCPLWTSFSAVSLQHQTSYRFTIKPYPSILISSKSLIFQLSPNYVAIQNTLFLHESAIQNTGWLNIETLFLRPLFRYTMVE